MPSNTRVSFLPASQKANMTVSENTSDRAKRTHYIGPFQGFWFLYIMMYCNEQLGGPTLGWQKQELFLTEAWLGCCHNWKCESTRKHVEISEWNSTSEEAGTISREKKKVFYFKICTGNAILTVTLISGFVLNKLYPYFFETFSKLTWYHNWQYHPSLCYTIKVFQHFSRCRGRV